MKKILSLILSVIICLPFCACSKKNEDETLKVICTIFPQYDFVREIAGDCVSVEMLLPFSVESHDFSFDSLTVAELKKVASADMFIYIGGPSDNDWVEELKKTVKNDKTEYLPLLSATECLAEELSNHSEHDGHDHSNEENIDEHIWTSPKRAIEIVNLIEEKLCQLDAENSDIYRQNANDYKAELLKADQELVALTPNATKLIFADRFAFRYLCYDYGFSYEAAFPGCSAATDPSVAQIALLTKSAKDSNAKSIFYLENSEPSFAQNVANSCNAKAVMLHSGHTVSKKDFQDGISYLSILKSNIKKISEALKEQ